ncbi:hypothetical protein SAMN05444161_8913 [Rhizobiales bacterium GAS191]|nr:hypothetical protein SAMN05444161_8913 [Rhizobiales bacterium GAS191]
MRRKFNMLLMAALGTAAFGLSVPSSASAQQPHQAFHDSYELTPVLVHDHVHSDPDGIWPQQTLNPPSGLGGSIYIARLNTPAGQWILSELVGAGCGLNGVCGFRLMFRKPDGTLVEKTEGDALVGATAYLTRDFKTLITDNNGPVQSPID